MVHVQSLFDYDQPSSHRRAVSRHQSLCRQPRTDANRQKLEEFWKAAAPTFEGFGAKRLAIYTPLTALELMGPLEAAFVYEFPDVATAKRWYESPAIKTQRSPSGTAA